jgi:hypothetical protein
MQTERPITERDVDDINRGVTKLYAFGFVQFTDSSGATTGCKAFIAFYDPTKNPGANTGSSHARARRASTGKIRACGQGLRKMRLPSEIAAGF